MTSKVTVRGNIVTLSNPSLELLSYHKKVTLSVSYAPSNLWTSLLCKSLFFRHTNQPMVCHPEVCLNKDITLQSRSMPLHFLHVIAKNVLMKYHDLIGAVTIVAVTQVLPMIVTRPLHYTLRSDYARLESMIIQRQS